MRAHFQSSVVFDHPPREESD